LIPEPAQIVPTLWRGDPGERTTGQSASPSPPDLEEDLSAEGLPRVESPLGRLEPPERSDTWLFKLSGDSLANSASSRQSVARSCSTGRDENLRSDTKRRHSERLTSQTGTASVEATAWQLRRFTGPRDGSSRAETSCALVSNAASRMRTGATQSPAIGAAEVGRRSATKIEARTVQKAPASGLVGSPHFDDLRRPTSSARARIGDVEASWKRGAAANGGRRGDH
jgi:hypothetical protein